MTAYLYIARGSAGEVRSMISLLKRLNPELEETFTELSDHASDISRHIAAWIGSLENSSIKGSRKLTDEVRDERAKTKRREGFLDQLRQIQSGPDTPKV